MSKFLEHTHLVDPYPVTVAASLADMFAGEPSSDVINMENAKSAVFIIKTAGGTGSASIQIVCVDAITAATTTTALSFNYKTITTPDTQGATTESKTLVVAGTDNIYAIEVDAAKLAEVGYSYIRLTATEKVAKPLSGTITAFLMGLRSAEDVTPTQLV